MNAPTPLPVLLEHLKWNLERLAEVLKNDKTDYFRNAALQRFGFTMDGAIRCIQSVAGQKNEPFDSLHSSLMFAHQQGWLKGDVPWEELEASYHAIKSEDKDALADALYDKLPAIYLEFECLLDGLNQIAKSDSQ